MTPKKFQPLVLVLSEDAETRQLVVSALHEHGYDVVEAATPGDGITRLGSLPNLSAIVWDLTGPGSETLHARLAKTRPDLPVVHLVNGDGARGPRPAGLSTEIGKPVDPYQIAYAVSNLISRE
jgi:CheY-like chemotaxis protein